MRLRARHQWKGPRRLRWSYGRLLDRRMVTVSDRCGVCGELWRSESIATEEAIGDAGTRSVIEAFALKSAERNLGRAWCYPNPTVRAFVHWLERRREAWRAFWFLRRLEEPREAQRGDFRVRSGTIEPVEGWPEPPEEEAP